MQCLNWYILYADLLGQRPILCLLLHETADLCKIVKYATSILLQCTFYTGICRMDAFLLVQETTHPVIQNYAVDCRTRRQSQFVDKPANDTIAMPS